MVVTGCAGSALPLKGPVGRERTEQNWEEEHVVSTGDRGDDTASKGSGLLGYKVQRSRPLGDSDGLLVDYVRRDATALQYYDNLGLELPTGLLSAMGPRLLQPSLTLLGYEDGIGTLASTRVVERLAREGLTQGLRVSVISGRDWSADLRAACLVGRPAARQIAGKRPRPDDPDLDARKYLGRVAEAGGRLSVLAVEELRRGDRPRTPVDLVLIDDVHGVDRLWGASDGGGDHNLPDASPQGLRHASRLMMCSIVVTVDWRLTERWRWTREADVVVDIELDEGLPVIRHGSDVERLPI